jgi:hypothetical protein
MATKVRTKKAQAEVPTIRLQVVGTTVKPIYLKPIAAFAQGKHPEQKGEITGLKLCIPGENPKEYPPRICYVVKYVDGSGDYIPVSDVEKGHYQMTLDSA